MKIAVPITENERFSSHYGASSALAVFDLRPEQQEAPEPDYFVPGMEGPCTWGQSMAERGIEVVLVGGMGPGAQSAMRAQGIKVYTGVQGEDPRSLVNALLQEALVFGPNACEDHAEHSHEDSGHSGRCACSH